MKIVPNITLQPFRAGDSQGSSRLTGFCVFLGLRPVPYILRIDVHSLKSDFKKFVSRLFTSSP